MSFETEYNITDEYVMLKDRLGLDRWGEIVDRNRAEGRGHNITEEVDIMRQELGTEADSIPRRGTPKGPKKDILSDIAAMEKTLSREERDAIRSMGGDLVGRRSALREAVASRAASPAPSPATPAAAISPEWRAKLDEQITRSNTTSASPSALFGKEKVRAVFKRQIEAARSEFYGEQPPARTTTPPPAATPAAPSRVSYTPTNGTPRQPLFGIERTRAVFKKQFAAIRSGSPITDPQVARVNQAFKDKLAARKPKAAATGELFGLAKVREAFRRQFAAKRN